MRLPWGQLESFLRRCPPGSKVAMLGCLSFEERCTAVVKVLAASSAACDAPHFLEIHDPNDAYPNYSKEIERRIEANWNLLAKAGVPATRTRAELLATEDDMLDHLSDWNGWADADIIVLDVSSFPKRYFCLLLKRLINSHRARNVVVTYSQAGQGYSDVHLCEDPMPCECLPGFGAPVPPSSESLVVSVGFEALNISALVKPFRETTRDVKFLLAFPPSVHTNQRQWTTLLEIASDTGHDNLKSTDIEMVSLWDAESVYHRLQQWDDERIARLNVQNSHSTSVTTSMSLAPFGPKPHSLGMALFAIKHRCGMYYTQPKSYNPDYSSGSGQCWYYIAKWDGIACFEREIIPL